MALVSNDDCVRQPIGPHLKVAVLRVKGHHVVGNDPDFCSWIQRIGRLLDNLDLVLADMVWQPLECLVFPHPPQGRWTDDENRPVLQILRSKCQALQRLAETHLIADEAAAAAAGPEFHAIKLVRQQTCWKPFSFDLTVCPHAMVCHLPDPRWNPLHTAQVLEAGRHLVMAVKGKDPDTAAVCHCGTRQRPNGSPDVLRDKNMTSSMTSTASPMVACPPANKA
mmetsp:Transcript_96035/g.190361  ORF Transcript_96035/g.190361 Transcript_96035/m.190361 type:complete len:223 (+) Transcript_96035:1651-2319(+)